jgi:hypothetical protein
MSRSQLTSTVEQNSGGAVAPYVAGKNAVINGGFDVWQRGTSFVPTTTAYGPDRWQIYRNTTNCTVSRQSPGSTLSQFQYCGRMQRDSGTTQVNSSSFAMTLETSESLKFSGQTATWSFYARAGANFSGSSVSALRLYFAYGTGTDQNVVTGFTGNVYLINAQVQALTTSWVKYSFTINIPSTATELGWEINALWSGTAGAADFFEVTGVQLEIGSVATPFARAGGSIGGELALCQRYYEAYLFAANGLLSAQAISTTATYGHLSYKVPKRGTPTIAATGGTFQVLNASGTPVGATFQADAISTDTARVAGVSASGLVAGNAASLFLSAMTITISAEL